MSLLNLKCSFGKSDVLLRLFVGPLKIGPCWQHMRASDRRFQRISSQARTPTKHSQHFNGKLEHFFGMYTGPKEGTEYVHFKRSCFVLVVDYKFIAQTIYNSLQCKYFALSEDKHGL